MKKLRIGITGCIGSGKSLVTQMLKVYGAAVVDMDKAGRWAVEQDKQVRHNLRQTFGDEYFDSNGALQRTKMASLVFSDQTALQKLNAIVHPVMLQHVRQLITTAEQQFPSAPYIIVDAALIFELHFEYNLDRIVAVSAPLQTCMQRLQQKSGLSRMEFLQRYNAQLPMEEKLRRADYVIENNGSLDSLRQKTLKLHQWLLLQSPEH